jgi:hypothetical protein
MFPADLDELPTPWELAVVVRYTPFEGVGPAECFEDADREAARLNAASRRGATTRYFVKILRQRHRKA